MVNAKKHEVLKVINSITAPERTAKQLENRKSFTMKASLK